MAVYQVFIPHINVENASVLKIIDWMHTHEIGVVEHVNLTGRYDELGQSYYEAVVYFEHMYESALGKHVKRIACLGGTYALEYKPGSFIQLQKHQDTHVNTKIMMIENRVKLLEIKNKYQHHNTYQDDNTYQDHKIYTTNVKEPLLVTDELLLKKKHAWKK